MSTKTTFKRIALVTVAALGLGVLSIAPSSAVVNSDSLTVSATTVAQSTLETATATSATATLSFLAGAGGATPDSMSVTASLVSGPATSTALPYLSLVETASAYIDTTAAVNRAPGWTTNPNEKAVVVNAASGAAQVSAKYKVYLGTSNVAGPAVAGTYVVKLTPALFSGTTGGGNATAQTITITVAPSVVNIATAGTVILNRGDTNSAVVDDVVTASKAATDSAGSATGVQATLKVSLLNALGTAANESFTATLTGPGTLGVATSSLGSKAKLGRAITVKATDVVQVYADGNAGVASIAISTASGVVLATKTVTFYGTASAITAKTTALLTGTIAKVGNTPKLVSFKVVDAAGVEVTTGSYYLVSNDTTKISNTYTACASTWDATDGWVCDVTGVAKGTGSVYVTNKPSATDTTVTTVIKSNDVSIRVGTGVVASVAVTTDKATYAPGEKISLKVTLKDADGNPVVTDASDYANIFATGGIVASYALGAASETTTATSVLKAVDGVKTYTLYAPNTQATVKFEWTTGTNFAVSANAGVDGSLSVTVADTALEAANAATTAALAANDAVDALAATVAKLVANLKAQITALTKLIVKIQKKVGA